MKTTIDVADPLLDEARELARREGTTLKALVDEGLRLAIAGRAAAEPYRAKMLTYGDARTQPGVDLADWSSVRSLLHGP